MKSIVAVFLLLASCAHAPKDVNDLEFGKVYPTLGAPKEDLKSCTLKLANVITAVQTEMGVVYLKEAGEDAMVCGELDCTVSRGPQAKGFQCIPLKGIQSSKSK